MTILKIIAIAYLITYILSIGVYLLRKSGLGNWLFNSLDYPFRKRRVKKLFKMYSDDDKMKAWLYYTDNHEEAFWYFRKLDDFICNKYIKPILKEHGEI